MFDSLAVRVLLAAAASYLIGSFSISRLVMRLMAPHADLETVELPDRGTGGTFQLKTVGATTASMVLGPRVGGMIGLLDIVKGLVPSLAARLLFPNEPLYLIVGIFTVVGHIWPVYYRFRGGGGLSPALGACLVIDPLGTLACTVIAFLLGFFVLKEIVVIVMGGTWLLIPWLLIVRGSLVEAGAVLLLNLLLALAVIPDVKVHLNARKLGKTNLPTSMEVIPMGRMMKKMMLRMGVKAQGEDLSARDPSPPAA